MTHDPSSPLLEYSRNSLALINIERLWISLHGLMLVPLEVDAFLVARVSYLFERLSATFFVVAALRLPGSTFGLWKTKVDSSERAAAKE
jgi:hypothetical protein